MATQPWVKPKDVKEYTDFDCVADRRDSKLAIDIARAEAKVISITGNRFENDELPSAVRTAVILLAEYYAYHAVEKEKKLKARTFDDYAETYAEPSGPTWEAIDLDGLLEDYVGKQPKGNVTMILSKL